MGNLNTGLLSRFKMKANLCLTQEWRLEASFMVKFSYFLSMLLCMQDSSSNNNYLLNEALPAWKAFDKDFFSSINGKIEFFNDSNMKPNQTVCLKAKQGLFLIEVDGIKPGEDRFRVFCKNYQYGFRLVGDNTRGWFIDRLLPISDPNFLEQLKLDEMSPLCVGLSPASVMVASLETLVTDQSFQILNTDKQSTGLVAINFALRGARSNKLLEQVDSGSLLLDPKKKWLPTSTEIIFASNFKILTEYIYIPESVLPVSSVSVTQFPNGTRKSKAVMNWNLDGNRLSDHDFTLSHYGLQEPDWVKKKTNWMVIVAAILCVVLLPVLLLVFQKRRISAS